MTHAVAVLAAFALVALMPPVATAQTSIPAPGYQPTGLAYDGINDVLYVAENSGLRTIYKIAPDTGVVIDSFLAPSLSGMDGRGNSNDLAYDGNGHLFVSDIGSGSSGVVFEVDLAASGGPAIVSHFNLPFRGGAIAFDGTNLYISDLDSSTILITDRTFTTICAYWHPFKQPNNTFLPNTQFETVWQRYRFNRLLRLAVMDAIERVEVGVRTALVHDLAMRLGAFAHVDHKNFPHASPDKHAHFLEELRKEALKSSEVFAQHFQATYDEFPDLPIWAVCETMTFGSMLTLFNMSERGTRNSIARRFGLHGPVLQSWLHTLSYVRNICAHHARLWNRELAIRPALPDEKNDARW